MRAGKLKYLITIEERSTATDAAGGMVDSWTSFATVYADVRTLSGRELDAALAVNSEVTHKWELRHLDGLLPEMRIVFEGEFFNILWVDQVNMIERQLFVYTSSGLAPG